MDEQSLLVVGQAFCRSWTPGEVALTPDGTGGAADRLVALIGCSNYQFVAGTERLNLIPFYPGNAGTGDAFPTDVALENVPRVLDLIKDRTTLVVGQGTAWALGVRSEPLRWLMKEEFQPVGIGTLMFIPHTSGVCRWYNDPSNLERAKFALLGIRRLLQETR